MGSKVTNHRPGSKVTNHRPGSKMTNCCHVVVVIIIVVLLSCCRRVVVVLLSFCRHVVVLLTAAAPLQFSPPSRSQLVTAQSPACPLRRLAARRRHGRRPAPTRPSVSRRRPVAPSGGARRHHRRQANLVPAGKWTPTMISAAGIEVTTSVSPTRQMLAVDRV